MTKVRVGIVGCGWIAIGAVHDMLRQSPRTHFEALTELSDCFDIVGICDANELARSNARRIATDIPVYEHINDLIKLGVELVVIATPGETHGEILDVCISAGVKFVLCEKPITHNLAEAQSLLTRSLSSGTKIVVNHMRRFSPLIKSAKNYIMRDQIIDTAVGNICSGDVYYDKGLYHGGTHIIDLLMFFFGDVKSLWATPCHRQVKHAEGDISGDLLLNFETCSISVRPFDSTMYSVSELRLYGEKGSLILSDMWGRRLTIAGIRQCNHFSAYYELDHENERVLSDGKSFMSHTYDHLRKVIYESYVDDSLEAAINTLRVIEVATTTIKNGGGYVELA